MKILRGKLTLPIIVFSIGVTLSAGLGLGAYKDITLGAQQRFNAVAHDAARKVEDRFEGYTEVLIGLRALFATSEPVTREQFRQYVLGLKLEANFPGFQVLNYAASVPLERKRAYEEGLRRDTALAPSLEGRVGINPPGERATYHPLTFIEPLAGNERGIGKDLAVIPAALQALEHARDTGALTSSGRKIEIKGRPSDIGLAMRLPVYRANMPLDTVEQRRAAYLGSVGSGFRIADIIDTVFTGPQETRPRLRFFDGGPVEVPLIGRGEVRGVPAPVGEASLLFDSAPQAAAAGGTEFERTLAFDMGGHSWIVQVSQSSSLVVGHLDRTLPWLIVLCGVAISMLLAGIIYSLTTSRSRAEAMALAMTQDVRRGTLRLTLEHEVARLLVTDGEPEAVISRVLEAICTHLRWSCGSWWEASEGGMVRCAGAWHVGGDPVLEQFVRISRSLTYRCDEGTLGRAWTTAQTIQVDTALATDHFTRDALANQAGMAVALVVPALQTGSATALELLCSTSRTTDAETIESLRAIGLQIAQYQQRKRAEQALRHIASHDALTGLPNRNSLQRDLARAIKRSNRHHKRFAVLFVDIDRFKRINDTLGHGVGDALIKACGERMTAVLREDDSVARFGGDEFVLIAENLSKSSDAAIVADKVLACCAEPFMIEGRELHVSASIGLSVYPEDGADSETLLKNADTAMYRAKDKGRGAHEFYAAQMNAQGSERLMLESALRRAVERGELELHYQPKMDLRTRRIVSVEALMRWRHPAKGMTSPAEFIPIAEETGLIVPMGKWALETACRDALDWKKRGLPPVQMSVNLSARQLNSPTIISDIDEVLNATGLNPAMLELEITESVMMKNPEQAAALLQQIRDMGVGLAIDDFGTGYSSLSYLRRFPLTAVKIDRSFVKDLSQDRDAEALTAGIITLAHGLHMRVIAEGVETVEQLDYLREKQCDEIQGYWLCKPVPAQEVCTFMARHLRNEFAAPAAA